MKRIRLWLVVCFLPVGLWAQLTRGVISGTVADPSGAFMPGVKVTTTHKETNAQRTVETNEVGGYRFSALEPGTYSVEFAQPGFESRRLENIRLEPNQEAVINQALAVAPAATTVEVVEAPPGVELNKATANITQTLASTFIANVPLTGATRDVTRLALLAPTVARAPGSNEFSANGQRARNNNFMIDGVDNNDPSVTLPNNRVIPEAVSQFQVVTSAYSAEFGRNTGAQVLMTTRSGTNELHGEVWDYYRGNWMEPVSLLNKRAGLTRTPRFVQNQAGGAVGGPVVKDRTFFYGLLETNRRREAPDARNAAAVVIPTPAGYAALSNVSLRAGQSAESRQAALRALSFLPEVYSANRPNFSDVRNLSVNGTPVQVGTARIPLANPYNFWYVQPRIDHLLTSHDTLTYRAQIDKRDQPDVTSNLGFGNRWSGAQTVLGQNHMLSHTHTFGPRMTNEFRFGYTRRNLDFPERDPVSPTIGITGSFTIGGDAAFPQARVSNTFQWQDVATLLLGRHSLRFGADLRRNRLFNRSGFYSKGFWTFNSLEDFLNNRAFSLLQAVNEASFDARQTNQFYFFQDDFRVTPNLTLNLGLRYEYSGVPFGFFGATNPQVRAALAPGPVQPDKNNWAPRLGFAYSPAPSDGFARTLFGDGQTVFRGGFGVAYDVLFFNIATVTASNYPRVVTSQQLDLVDVFPSLLPRIATIPPFNPLLTLASANEDMQSPTAHFWSFSIQRQLAANYIFEIGYSGNRSYHQIRQGQLNPARLTPEQAQRVIETRNPNSIPGVQQRRLYPQFGSRVMIESTALGEYHGGFVRLDKRFSNGLMFGFNYTYSGNWSDNDESLAVADIVNSSPPVPQDYLNYRNEWARSVFDRPHRFVVHYSYQVPWFTSGAAGHPALRRILGGWELTGFNEWQTGQPFTIRTGVDSSGSGDARPHRPHYNPAGAFQKDGVEGNLRTFRLPIDGTGVVITPLTASGLPLTNSMPGGGNLGRNTFRGPSFFNWNLSLGKLINITERWRVQVRGDWINFLNHRNFGNPVSTMVSPAFGTNTTDPGGRTMLLGAKLLF